MDIQQEEKETKGVFFIRKESKIIAKMTYSKAGKSRIIIDHTEVSDEHRGEGLGEKLVAHVVENARRHNITILPLCPFARSVFERKTEFSDVL